MITEPYQTLLTQLKSLLESERDPIANAANWSALLFEGLTDINWAGVYFLRDGELVVGPFQGQPACTRIAMGRGVCGTAAQQRTTVVVENVHEFPGHIACDSASNSEIVVPLADKTGRLVGVLDIDSPVLGRFGDEDRAGLEAMASVYIGQTEF